VTVSAARTTGAAPANETYPHGLLTRPRFGFEWRDGPPEGRSGDGLWLVAKGGESAVVAVRGTARLLWEFQTDAGMVSGAIRPPRGKAFLRRFIRLDPDSPDQIREFANRYGSLSNPLADPLSLWQQEIPEVRDLADTLDEAASSLLYDRHATAALAARFRQLPLEETLEAGERKTAYLHRAELSRRLLGQRPVSRVVTYTYGLRMLVFASENATKLGYRELGQITDGKALVTATEALVRFARICVQEVIERRLWGAHVGVIYDYGKGAPQPPSIVPATVLGALYLELDSKLRGPSLPPRECAQCGRLIERSRRTRRFCGPACRKAAWRRNHPDGSQEQSRGL
jgi:hypothetical protein